MKLWAHHPGGTISEPLISLPDDLTPGKDIFAAFALSDLTDVTARDPLPSQGWITSDGGETFVEPPPPAPSVPFSVSSAQAKIQLRRSGLRDKVDAAVQSAGGEVLDWFTDARTWERSNPYVSQIGKALNLKAADIDALFVSASQIAA